MYLDFYQLEKAPFHITPDPAFLFLSPSHKATLGAIIYGIEERQGFVAISGEVGLGKTTILRSYLERVDQRQLKTIYIFNANVSFRGLLKAIFGEFGLEYETDDLFEMVNYLHQVLIEEYKQGRNVALIIDEAQNMPVETLENLRMLSNLETATEKLVQIVLIGQPEFDHKLNLNELRQLKQRIVIRSMIEPLTPEESLTYIHHRLAKVTLTDEPIFTKGALKQIVDKAKGTPRALNILCTNTLIAGFGYRQKPIKAKTAKEVIAEFEGKKKSSLLKPALAFAVAVMVGAGLLWLSPYRDQMLDHLAQAGYFQEALGKLKRQQGNTAAYAPETQEAPLSSDNPFAYSPFVDVNYVRNNGQNNYRIDHISDTSHRDTIQNNDVVSEMSSQKIDMHEEEVTKIQNLEKDIKYIDENKDNSNSEDHKESIFPLTKTIVKGDYISRIAVEVYGFTNSRVIEAIKNRNPQIEDMNRVDVGDKIIFPKLDFAPE
jgi:general secretion pathway protein A